MKSTFIKLSAFATIGLVLASCNNEEANKKAQEADALAVQALVESKNLELDSAVWAECDAKVLVAAEEAVANAKKSTSKPTAKKPAVKPSPVNPKANKFGGDGSVTKEQTEQKANKFSNEAATGKVAPTEEQTQKKKDKFK